MSTELCTTVHECYIQRTYDVEEMNELKNSGLHDKACDYCKNHYQIGQPEYGLELRTKFDTITTHSWIYMCDKCHASHCPDH